MSVAATCLRRSWLAGCCRQQFRRGHDARDRRAAGSATLTIWWAQWAPADGLQELGRRVRPKENGRRQGPPDSLVELPGPGVPISASRRPPSTSSSATASGSGAARPKALPGPHRLAARARRHQEPCTRWRSGTSPSTRPAAASTSPRPARDRRDRLGLPQGLVRGSEGEGRLQGEVQARLAVPETWEELKDIAEFFTGPTRSATAYALLTGRGYDAHRHGLPAVAWAFGGAWGDPARLSRSRARSTRRARPRRSSSSRACSKYAPPGGSKIDYGKALEAIHERLDGDAMNYFAFYPRRREEDGRRRRVLRDARATATSRFASLGGQGMSISTKIPPDAAEAGQEVHRLVLEANRPRRSGSQEAAVSPPTPRSSRATRFKAATPVQRAVRRSRWTSSRTSGTCPSYNELLAARRSGSAKRSTARSPRRTRCERSPRSTRRILSRPVGGRRQVEEEQRRATTEQHSERRSSWASLRLPVPPARDESVPAFLQRLSQLHRTRTARAARVQLVGARNYTRAVQPGEVRQRADARRRCSCCCRSRIELVLGFVWRWRSATRPRQAGGPHASCSSR